MWSPKLKLNPDRELQLARVGCAINTGSLSDRSILFDVAAGEAKVDVIERVEGVHIKPQSDPLGNAELFVERNVGLEVLRTLENHRVIRLDATGAPGRMDLGV